jgi:hypothetical protein
MHESASAAGALVAEFASAHEMREALATLRAEGYTALESFAPFPVPGAEGQSGGRRSRLPLVVFGAGLLGAVASYVLQWYVNAWSYPLNIGGRPTHAAPAFVVSTFEGAVLSAALAAVVGVMVALRLPRLWHPVFEIDLFERTTADRYWVAVDLRDPRAHPELAARELAALRPLRVVRLESGV